MAAEETPDFKQTALIHLNVLYRAGLRLTRNEGDAEDLVQETFLRAYRAWDGFRPGSNCRAWLLRIQRNAFINQYRRRRKEREVLQGERDGVHGNRFFCPDTHQRRSDPTQQLLESGLSDDVEQALNALPEAFRTVVQLVDLESRSYKEVAAVMGTPIGTVMSRLFRARKELRQQLAHLRVEHGIATGEAESSSA
jgi:RNA polymerase sigma-70 factor (ECF subfamily)